MIIVNGKDMEMFLLLMKVKFKEIQILLNYGFQKFIIIKFIVNNCLKF
jgi:hypothetical protein